MLFINQVIIEYDGLDDYLKVVDAFVDIVLQNHMVRLSMFAYLLNEKKVPVVCDIIPLD